jgi:hypothetical protein
MKVLLLHPDDDPLVGPWVGRSWDVVFDLGRSGWPACERWRRFFGCSVKPIDGLRTGFAETGRVRELLQMGLGRLVDREGLDWWELTAILIHHQLEAFVLLRKLANSLQPDAEVWLTRAGFEADALRQVLGERVHVMSSPTASSSKGLGHSLGRLRRLPLAQVMQILGDKYDAGYKVRRHFHRRPARSQKPVVLVPSSYVNMSLTAVAYARLAPDHDFLLVPTRSSGRLNEVPENVRQVWLASYADDSSRDEYREIVRRWEGLRRELESVPELAAVARLGLMDDFPSRFAYGLAIRDAWLRVLSIERVEAVLCCDDSNPATHIPMLLGRRRGLLAISCHHGALDGRYLMKTCHADVILAKGAMELDYLVETCGVDSSVVEIGAPSAPESLGNSRADQGDWIVFFSEPYEMTAGRAEEIYRDVIPGLGDLAKRNGKTLVVKLHPSENLKDRQSLAAKVLTRGQCAAIQWHTGGMSFELLRRTWFGVAVLSSVAVDCVVHGVPCFLCEWLDLWPYGYVTQYRKFGVALGLRSPSDIPQIPEVLAEYRPSRKTAESCCEPITPERFREILAGRRSLAVAPLGMQRTQ